MADRPGTGLEDRRALVTGAATGIGRSTAKRLAAEWERVLGVNLTGPFLCSREFARRLGEHSDGAVIVNVTSVHELMPWPGYAHYCASKGGLKLFGQTIARELGPRGVRVINVAPGA